MIPQVKITMVGGNGSGKTCYLLAMYAVMSMGFRGYTCTANSNDDDLDLSYMWDDIRTTGTLPQTTEQTRSWPFAFSFGFKRVLGLEWHDYRGGLLKARESESADVAKVKQLISDSDTIIICLPAEKLIEYANGRADRDTEVIFKKFNQIMVDFSDAKKRSVPIVINVTKADLFTSAQERDAAVEQIQGKILQAFFVRGGEWPVMLSFTTLGRLGRLAPDEKADPAKVEPACVHMPVMFAIHTALEARYGDAEQRSLRVASELDNERARQSSFGGRARAFFGKLFASGMVARDREALSSLQSALGAAEEECKRLLGLMDFVKEELRNKACGQRFFFDGTERSF